MAFKVFHKGPVYKKASILKKQKHTYMWVFLYKPYPAWALFFYLRAYSFVLNGTGAFGKGAFLFHKLNTRQKGIKGILFFCEFKLRLYLTYKAFTFQKHRELP